MGDFGGIPVSGQGHRQARLLVFEKSPPPSNPKPLEQGIQVLLPTCRMMPLFASWRHVTGAAGLLPSLPLPSLLLQLLLLLLLWPLPLLLGSWLLQSGAASASAGWSSSKRSSGRPWRASAAACCFPSSRLRVRCTQPAAAGAG